MSQTTSTNQVGPRAARTATGPEPLRFGSFESLRLLGAGQLASVYLARDAESAPELPADYAVKVLRPEWNQDDRGWATLMREVQAARAVSHPHLVPILSSSLRHPPFFVVMPYLEGHSIERLLQCEVSLDLPYTLWLTRQVAEALTALAHAGWTHGDVKPSNVIVGPWGHVTLVDLGFASPAATRGLLVDRPVLGTVSYMAPELLFSSQGGDAQSDVYSLGVMLFEMLTGRLPFDAEDVAELALQHRQELPCDVRRLVPHVPTRVARLVQQSLAKDPLRRPTASEMVERLVSLEIESFAERNETEQAA